MEKETNKDVFITYDISGQHQNFKDKMKDKGYMDRWEAVKDKKTVTYFLPNTSLWKPDTKLEQVSKDVNEVFKAVNDPLPKEDKIKMERLIYMRFDKFRNWSGIIGDSHV